MRRTLVAGVLIAAGCREPTQITVEVITDVACSDSPQTAVVAGRFGGDFESRPPAAEARGCAGRVGSVVLIPSGARDEEVAIRVVTGVGDKTPERCIEDGYKGGCIVARRVLRYVPHTPLTVITRMKVACRDLPCEASQTCVDGRCVSAMLSDPGSCSGAGCDENALAPPADASADVPLDVSAFDGSAGDSSDSSMSADTSPVADASGDASLADASVSDTSIVDAATDTFDASVPAIAIADIELGGFHSCARRIDGEAWCWGGNNRRDTLTGDGGQLGDGTLINRPSPTPVSALIGAAAIAGGEFHTCARMNDGTVRCWGWNGHGQIGDTTTLDRLVPTPVPSLTAVLELRAFGSHNCARTASSVACWGRNASGQLGDGLYANRSAPNVVAGLTNVAELAGGRSHTCARMNTGAVSCWGRNADGQLGDGSTTGHPTPTTVTGLTDAVAIYAGGFETCARRVDESVVCFGLNTDGEIGDGTTSPNRSTPTVVKNLGPVSQVAVGGYHACALRTDGTVACWGDNEFGQIGDGTNIDRLAPTPAQGLTSVVEISAGIYHTCARRSTGQVLCWGANGNGRVGDGTEIGRKVPTLVGWP